MNKRNYIRGTLLLILLVSSLFFTLKECRKSPLLHYQWINKYGPDINELRDSLNIPVIEDGWVAHHFDSTQIYWAKYPKGVTTVDPMHLYKAVLFENGLPTTENDGFHYETPDSIAFRLECIYSYPDKISSFHFIRYFKGQYPPTESFTVNHAFADSIFHAWGFHNYYDESELLEREIEANNDPLSD